MVLRQFLRVITAFGAPLNAPLLSQDALELLDVRTNSLLLALQAIGPIFALQKIQNLTQIGVHFGLLIDGLLQLLLGEEIDKRLHLGRDSVFFASRQGLLQERRAARIRRRVEFCHAQHEHFEPTVLLGDLILLPGQAA